MKSLIIYFSSTGNTKKIAEAIHRGMSRVVDQCDIVPLKEVEPLDLAGYDLIGVGSPVWRNDVPTHVLAFMDYAFGPKLKSKHCFIFCTHGAMASIYIPSAIAALERKGLTVIGWNDWYAEVHLPYMAKPYFTDGHPDAIDLKQAEDFGREMAERSQRVSLGETELIPDKNKSENEWVERYGGRFEHHIVPPGCIEPIKTEFKINADKCTRCMLCVDNCPTHSIELETSPPIIKQHCVKCFLCEMLCPTGAIEADYDLLSRSMRQFTKPLVEKELEIARSRGDFRLLIPLDTVCWDPPPYKRTGHPRFKIEK